MWPLKHQVLDERWIFYESSWDLDLEYLEAYWGSLVTNQVIFYVQVTSPSTFPRSIVFEEQRCSKDKTLVLRFRSFRSRIP